jgi:hypothetical protein
MSLLEILAIIGLIVLLAVLVCGAVVWRQRHRTQARDIARSKLSDQTPARNVASQEASAGSIPPSVLGKLRAGREDDRPSEDDLVRMHMGPRGVPGEAAPANTLGESETQIPKPLDPGHTA